MFGMTWHRIAAFALGAGTIAAGMLIPGAQPFLVPAGAGLLGLATRWPEDARGGPHPEYPRNKKPKR